MFSLPCHSSILVNVLPTYRPGSSGGQHRDGIKRGRCSAAAARARLPVRAPAALSQPSLLCHDCRPGRARGRSCGSWIAELRRQKAANWEGFDPSCHWTRCISERARHGSEMPPFCCRGGKAASREEPHPLRPLLVH